MNAIVPADKLTRADTIAENGLATSSFDPATLASLTASSLVALAADLRSRDNILELWKKYFKPADAAFDRKYKDIERAFKSPLPAQGIAAIGQAVIKAVIGALEKQGKVSKYDVVGVGRDTTHSIVFYVTKDGKVIGHNPSFDGQDLIPNVFGFDFNFLGKFGYFTPKEFVVLVLPNGDCILIRAV